MCNNIINNNELNSYTCDFNCQSIVSAGAGTGKTYNIQILVLRKVLEGTPIEKILVVTYTNLATEELQDRLRKILQRALEYCHRFIGKVDKITASEFDALQDDEKKQFQQVHQCLQDKELRTIIPYLQNALHDFDFASISTIHGFCSRTLADNAFESGLRYGLEMRKKNDALCKAIICEFFRKLIASGNTPDANTRRCALLQVAETTPQKLVDKLKTALSNPRVNINWGRDLNDNPISMLSSDEIADQLNVIETEWDPATSTDDNAPKIDTYNRLLMKAAYDYMVRQIKKTKQRDGFITFDDLLVELLARLDCNDQNATKLRQLIRDKYDCVLIDEFQDTDAVQSAIFDKIFGESDQGTTSSKTIFYIGDEKQAIYKFRGGDVQTFQRKKDSIAPGNRYTLLRNFRSSGEYIAKMNQVFAQDFFQVAMDEAKAYGSSEENSASAATPKGTAIEMPEIKPSDDGIEKFLCDENGNRLPDDSTLLLSLCLIDAKEGMDIFSETAREIKALHDSKYRLREKKNGIESRKEIQFKDFAILLRSKTNVDKYREAMKKLGIPSVFMQGKSIFKTQEATWMLAVMDAILNPGDQSKALNFLANPILDIPPEILEIIRHEHLADIQIKLKKNNDLWNKKSFFFMFNEFLNHPLVAKKADVTPGAKENTETNSSQTPSADSRLNDNPLNIPLIQQIVNASQDGGHVLSIVLQLAEKLMGVSLEGHLGPEGLHHFLENKIRSNRSGSYKSHDNENASVDEDEDDDEVFPVHMTTQEDAVRILTIHKSKGLEFPIVFVPQFTTNHSSESVFHDEKSCRCINMDGNDESLKALCDLEKHEESRRLMYVAITRACYLCRFLSKSLKEKDDTKMKNPEFVIPLRMTPQEWSDALPASTTAAETPPTSTIENETFGLQSGELHPGWITTSFSTLAKGKVKSLDDNAPKPTAGGTSAVDAQPLDTKDTPDDSEEAPATTRFSDDDDNESTEEKGDFSQGDTSLRTPWVLTPYADRTPLFQFPGGTRTGTCWHEILENLDFTLWKDGDATEAQEASWAQVEGQLKNYAQLGNDKTRAGRIEAFKSMLANICNTPIFDGNIQLCHIPMERTRREFDFTYRIREGMTADEIRKLLETDGIAVPADWAHKIGKQNLTGSIDLIFQEPENGKFYILDWKTNILEANAESFTQENVKKEIDYKFYSFQCVLYTLAFVQYYRQLKHGVNFTEQERVAYTREAYAQFGGCADMLVRGMDGKGDHSVHYLMPSEELILALDGKIGVGTAHKEGK